MKKMQMKIKNMKIYKIYYHSPKWKVDAFVVENLVTNHPSVDKEIKYQDKNGHATKLNSHRLKTIIV